MKKLSILLLSLIMAITLTAQKDNGGDKILGTWQTGSGKGRIQITKYGGDKYGGKIVWLKEPTYADGTNKRDKNNPDPAKRNNPTLGLNNLLGFVYAGKGKYENGSIYDPEKGKTYSCVMTLKDDNTLDVRGYVGISLIGRTDTWTRVK